MRYALQTCHFSEDDSEYMLVHEKEISKATAFIKERLGAMHARGALAGVAQGLNARRQRALMALMQ